MKVSMESAIPPSPSGSSDGHPQGSFDGSGTYHSAYNSARMSEGQIPMHYGTPPQYFHNNSFSNMSTHQVMSALVSTPPPTSDEASLSHGSPSAGSPGWSPPRAGANQRLRNKQTRRKKSRKETSLPAFKLDGPISVLTASPVYRAPIRDMEAYVRRSTDERRQEVKHANGKISRPMNCFLLYRSAMTARVKEYIGANNHQIVSRVTGESWKLESDEVKARYTELASIERVNHAIAHPEYKFSPNKNGACERDSSAAPSYTTEDAGFSDMDCEPHVLPARPYSHSRSQSFEDYGSSRDTSPFGGPETMMLPNYVHTPWNTSHPMPIAYPTPQIEDLHFRSPSPNHGITYESSLAGLPGAAHPELLQQSTQSLSTSDMDPRLLSQSNDIPTISNSYQSSYSGWTDEASQGYYPATSAPSVSSSTAPYSQPNMASAYLPSMQAEGRELMWDMSRPGEGMADPSAAEFEMWCTASDPALY